MRRAILHYRAGPMLRQMVAQPRDGWQVEVIDDRDVAAFDAALPGADAILHVLSPLDRARLERAPKLTLVQKIGVGVDTIDLDAARALGIGVANMPGTNAQAVAEHAIGLMLAVLRQVPAFDAATRAGEGWTMAPARVERVGELAGRTIGLVGFGEIPRRMAPILAAFGARVIYHARSDHSGTVATRVSLDRLLAEADIVSLHLPLTAETSALIGPGALARMKDGAVLINTARGALIDEAAVAAALASGKLMGAGLDVFAAEPTGKDNPLFRLPNVVASPHLAWLTPETFRRSLDVAFENLRRAAGRSTLLHEIAPVRR